MDGDLGQYMSVAIRRLVGKLFSSKTSAGARPDETRRDLESRLAHDIVRLCEGMCWSTESRIW